MQLSNRKKIYISTFCVATSFGSVFQAYALKKTLESLNVSSSVISNRAQNDPNRFLFYRKNNSVKNVLTNLNMLFHKKKCLQGLKENILFIRKNFDLVEYDSYEELKQKHFNSNVFLAGSDQIFNPSQCNPVFFLDFVPNGAKRLSYAASMGSTVICAEKEAEFSRLLNQFDSISLREQEAATLAKQYTDKEIFVNIDPTFLQDSNTWRSLEKSYPVSEKYILLYPLYWDRSLNSQLKELHKRTGLPIICIGATFASYHQKTICNASLEQFLWLVDHAEYVVTSSFHGAALSINFGKKTSIVVNPALPSRLNHLSNTLEYPIVPISQLDRKEDFNFDVVNRKIEEEKKKSIEYLKRVICNE